MVAVRDTASSSEYHLWDAHPHLGDLSDVGDEITRNRLVYLHEFFDVAESEILKTLGEAASTATYIPDAGQELSLLESEVSPARHWAIASRYMAMLQFFPEALAHCQQGLSIVPNDEALHFIRIRTLWMWDQIGSKGDAYWKERHAHKKMLKESMEAVDWPRWKDVPAAIEHQVQGALFRGKHREAMRSIISLLTVDPADVSIHYYVALLHMMSGHHYEALLSCTNGLELSGEDLRFTRLMAELLIRAHAPLKAISILENAQEIYPLNQTLSQLKAKAREAAPFKLIPGNPNPVREPSASDHRATRHLRSVENGNGAPTENPYGF